MPGPPEEHPSLASVRQPPQQWATDDLAKEARQLILRGDRRILGITGTPGSGKSTLAAQLLERLLPDGVVVGMDGFHLANRVLDDLGLLSRKGAPETFDAAGFHCLLSRLRANHDDVVYAPEFRREIGEPIAGTVAVDKNVPLVIVEGNYLLLDDGAWRGTRSFFDEIWYVQVDASTRRDRLIRRHIAYGKSPSEARAFVIESDEKNAALVEATAFRADKVIGASVA